MEMDPKDWYGYVCGNPDLFGPVITWTLAAIAGSSFLANFRKKLPDGLVKVLDFVGMNFFQLISGALAKKQEKKG